MANLIRGFFDKLKLADDDDYDMEAEEEEARLMRQERAAAKRELRKNDDSFDDDAEGFQMGSFFESRRKAAVKEDRSNKIVPLKRTTASGLEVCVIRPLGSKEAYKVSDKLLEGSAVILNLEGIDPAEAQMIMDFVFGSMYAISGKYSKISAYNFVFLPKDVDLDEALGEGSFDRDNFDEDDFEIPLINRDF